MIYRPSCTSLISFLVLILCACAQNGVTVCDFDFGPDLNPNGYLSHKIVDTHPINLSISSVSFTPEDARPRIESMSGPLAYHFKNRFIIDSSEPGRAILVANDTLELFLFPSKRDEITLSVQVECKGTAYNFISLTISHVNTYPPWFYRTPYNISIPENTVVGQLVDTQILAMDWDPAVAYDVTFAIEGGDPDQYFELVIDNNFLRTPPQPPVINGEQYDPNQMPPFLRLRLLKPLDYDYGFRTFLFNISATDGDIVRPKKNWTTLQVNIEDSDDLTPTFNKTVYQGTIRNVRVKWIYPQGSKHRFYIVNFFEDPAQGNIVELNGLIHAVDGDPTLRAPIIYSMDSSGGDSRYFMISSNEGFLSVISPLPKDRNLFQFEIRATQADNALQYTRARVELIYNEDEIGTPIPLGKPSFSSCTFDMEIRENSVEGSEVGRLLLKDDTKTTQALFTKSNNSDAISFALNIDTGIISVALGAVLDRESQEIYTFEVHVDASLGSKEIETTGENDASICTTATVTVKLIDENDNSPKFDAEYKFTIPDSIQSGSKVGVVRATDSDKGDAGTVVYEEQIPNLIADEDDEVTFQGDPKPDGSMEILILFSSAGRPKLRPFYKLTVIAYDNDDIGKREGGASVTVTVVFGNSHVPVFDPKEYSVSIPEHFGVGQLVVQVTAIDQDQGDSGKFTYALVEENNAFDIDENTGEITVADSTKLDRQKVQQFSLVVKTIPLLNASNVENPGGSTTATVVIDLEDINDNTPIFYNEQGNQTDIYLFTIDYDAAVDSFVGKVEARDVDADVNGEVVLQPFLVPDEFQLNTDGIITVAKVLPRRTVIRDLVVKAVDSPVKYESRSSFATVRITILYTEKNAPVFINLPKSVAVSEAVKKGTPVFYLSASDPDAGSGILQGENLDFKIVSGDEFAHFNIQDSAVTVVKPLDAEISTNFDLIISVFAKGDLARSNNSTLSIEVLDVNDHAPVFTQPLYGFIVEQDQLNDGSLIGKVHANDSDESDVNNLITYSLDFSTASDVNADRIFSMDANTGDVSFLAIPEMITRSYFFTAIATDSGTPKYQTSVRVTVTLSNDVTDLPGPDPRDKETKPTCNQIQYGVSLLEGLEAPINVMRINCYHSTQLVEYRLLTPVDVELDRFSIGPSGTIVANKPFDYETRTQYDLTVQSCLDLNNPASCISTPVIISISDANDNSPTFNRTQYNINLPANLSDNSFVIRVEAQDEDSGKAGEIQYSLRPGIVLDYFVIDSYTGEIRTRRPLDITRFNLQVEAFDSGVPRLGTVVQININVTGISREAPVFKKSIYEFAVDENVIKGHEIGHLQAVFPDTDSSTGIEYSLLSQSSPFDIDPETGMIFTKGLVNYELESIYQMNVQATDSLSRQKFGLTTVRVQIRDKNDPATFRPLHKTLLLPRSKGVGTKLFRLYSVDEDKNPLWNKNKLELNDTGGYFKIVNESLIINRVLDIDDYTFWLIVRDENDASVENTHQMQVRPQNDRSLYPIFPQLNYELNVPYSLPALIHKFQAEVYSRSPIYKIIEGSPPNNTLQMTENGDLTANLDFKKHLIDAGDVWFIVVRAENPANLSVYYSDVVVKLIPGVLEFEESLYTTNLTENTPVGTRVNVDVQIGDPSVLYELSPSDLFRITDAGDVVVAKDVDLETINVNEDGIYKLTIFATDGKTTASTSLHIDIEDQNEYGPLFNEDDIEILITDSIAPGEILTTISANDEDFSDHNKLQYSANNCDIDSCVIDVKSDGTITRPNKDPLDLEFNFTYEIIATATDHAGEIDNIVLKVIYPPKASTVPRFAKKVYDWNVIEENNGINQQLQLEVQNGVDVDFRIIQGNSDGKFVMEKTQPNAAILIVTSKLDRESETDFTLTVEARNKEDLALHDFATVEVFVKDVNDNPPVFESKQYSKQIPADFPVGFTILQVSAYDPDFNSSLSYSFIDATQSLFIINSATGDIELAKPSPLRNETYRLTAVVSDGQTLDTSSVAIEIYITPVQCNIDGCSTNATNPGPDNKMPKFSQNSYNFSVPENQAGVFIGRMSLEDLTSDIRFSIENPTYKNIFRIDENSGDIYARNRISYFPEREDIYFLVIARNIKSGAIAYAPVWIDINDQNDNAPEFSKNQYVTSLPYFAKIGDTVDLDAQATDNDKGINSQIFYSVSGRDVACFWINSTTAVVLLQCPIDSTRSIPYEIKITATDLNGAGNSNSVPVTIFVTPAPGKSTGFVTFPGSQTNSLFATDTTINNVNTGGTNAPSSTKPTKDPQNMSSTGNSASSQSTKSGTDSTQNPGIGSTLIGTDQGTKPTNNPGTNYPNPTKSTSPTNPTKPTKPTSPINPTNPTKQTKPTEPTNPTKPPSSTNPIKPTSSTNPTKPTNSTNSTKPTNSINPTNPTSPRNPTNPTGLTILSLSTSSSSRNPNPSDPSSTPNNGGSSYSPSECELLLLENFQDIALIPGRILTGTSLYASTVLTSGLCYDDIKYELDGVGTQYFSINENTGVFKISNDINMTRLISEPGVVLLESNVYSFNMSVTISASNAESKSQILRIRLIQRDINQGSRLKFTDGAFTFSVYEEQANSTSIGKIRAVSSSGSTAPIEYSVEFDYMFYMDPNDPGSVLSIRPLDRELPNGESHMIIVKAKQGNDIDYAMVLVIVEDINDFPPAFERDSYSFSVLEGNYETSYVVDSVEAIDLDDGANGKVTYAINTAKNGAQDLPFFIDPTRGIIRMFGSVDHEVNAAYNFTVTATDGSNESLTAEISVTISVIDVNDNAPVFIDPPMQVLVFDDLGLGENVTQVRAVDADSGVYGQVLYSLLTHKDIFDIQGLTGLVRLLRPLEATVVNQYFLLIEANDLAPGTSRLRSDINITVNVMPAGQDRPGFIQDVYNVQVPPKITPGEPFVQLSAGLIGQLDYSITESTAGSLFTIDSTSGQLSLIREPFRNETGITQELTVTATNITSLATDTAKIQIFLISRPIVPNPGEKYFDQTQYWVDIEENKGGRTLVIDLNSTYEGDGTIYQFVTEEPSVFSNFEIDNEGKIYAVKKLDREIKSHYFLKVNVTLPGRKKRQAGIFPSQLALTEYFKVANNEALVVVNVTDMNDNEPEFSMDNYVFTIGPTTSRGTPIDKIEAFDADIGEGLVYSIRTISDADDSDKFTMNSQTGELSAAVNFVSTSQSEFIIRVQVTDGYFVDEAHVKIYKWTQDKLVVLVSDKPERKIRHAMQDLALKMSQLTGWNVSINGVTSHVNEDDSVDPNKSDIYVYAIDPSTRKPVPGETLAKRLQEVLTILREDQYLVTLNLLESVRPAASTRANLKVSTAEIILIVICSIIIFIALVGVLFAFKWCATRDRSTKISSDYMLDTQSGGPRPYDTDTLDRKTATSLFAAPQPLYGTHGLETNAGQDVYIPGNSYASNTSLMARAALYYATANRLPYYHQPGPPSPPRPLPFRPTSPMVQRETKSTTLKL